MKKLTREQILDLRNSLSVWQQDYDSVHDKEQHDMFALAVVAMNEMLAAMDGKDAERREWMARGVEAAFEFADNNYAMPSIKLGVIREYADKIRAGEVDL